MGHWLYPAQDGTIEYQIKLTGELSTNPLSPDEDPSSPTYGTLVAKDVNAQAHQHLVRLVSTCPESAHPCSGGALCQVGVAASVMPHLSCDNQLRMLYWRALTAIGVLCSSAPGWTLQWTMQRAERASLSARQALFCSLPITALPPLSDQPDVLAGRIWPFLPICWTLTPIQQALRWPFEPAECRRCLDTAECTAGECGSPA